LIKPTILRCISSIQGVFVGLLVPWTQDVAVDGEIPST
jgi:hypothetical protein